MRMPLDGTNAATDTLSHMSPADRDLVARVQRQLRDNEVSLRLAREQLRRDRTDMERSSRIARDALRHLRAAGVLR